MLSAGCSTSVKPPPINAQGAAQNAVAMFDKDNNGVLNEQELAAAPGLQSAVSVYDTNQDQKLSQEEIAAGIESCLADGVALTTFSCRVLWQNEPLPNATVRLIPEPIFDGAIAPAVGTTDETGTAAPSVSEELLPDNLRHVKGLLHHGIYRVEITHDTVKIPIKYNTATTLGVEIGSRTWESAGVTDFRLGTVPK